MLDKGTKAELIEYYKGINQFWFDNCPNLLEGIKDCWYIENQINDCYSRGFRKFKIFYQMQEEIPARVTSLEGEKFSLHNSNSFITVIKQRMIKSQEIEITD